MACVVSTDDENDMMLVGDDPWQLVFCNHLFLLVIFMDLLLLPLTIVWLFMIVQGLLQHCFKNFDIHLRWRRLALQPCINVDVEGLKDNVLYNLVSMLSGNVDGVRLSYIFPVGLATWILFLVPCLAWLNLSVWRISIKPTTRKFVSRPWLWLHNELKNLVRHVSPMSQMNNFDLRFYDICYSGEKSSHVHMILTLKCPWLLNLCGSPVVVLMTFCCVECWCSYLLFIRCV